MSHGYIRTCIQWFIVVMPCLSGVCICILKWRLEKYTKEALHHWRSPLVGEPKINI